MRAVLAGVMMFDPTKMLPGAMPPKIVSIKKPSPAEEESKDEKEEEEEKPQAKPQGQYGRRFACTLIEVVLPGDGKLVHVTKGRAKIKRGKREAPTAIAKVWDNPNKGRENVVKEVRAPAQPGCGLNRCLRQVIMGEMLYGGVLTNFVSKFMGKVAASPGAFNISKEQVCRPVVLFWP